MTAKESPYSKTWQQQAIRNDGLKNILQHSYQGPYRVIGRTDKFFKVEAVGRIIIVSIDRFKPAYGMTDDIEKNAIWD